MKDPNRTSKNNTGGRDIEIKERKVRKSEILFMNLSNKPKVSYKDVTSSYNRA